MMFRRVLRTHFFVFLFTVCVFSAAGDEAGILRGFAEYTLQNGMQVFVLEDFAAAPIRIEYAVKAGTREQTPKTAGFFPLYTRLFAEAGKASYPEQADDWILDSAKISCDADAVRCVVTIAPGEIEKALSELAYCAFSPSFSDANIAAQFTALKSEVMNIIGEVKGKVAVLIDDMIDTAGTITLAAQAIKDAGAEEVYACCTHAVLSGPALERINNSVIKEVVVTDSIEVPAEKTGGKIVQISVDQLMAEAIRRIHENRSVSPLFIEKFTILD